MSLVFKNVDDTRRRATFEQGKLVLPICERDNYLKVFFVCPGLDENDNIPSWTVDCFPEEIGLKPLPKDFTNVSLISTF